MTQLTKPVRDARAQAGEAVRNAATRAGGAMGLLARAGYVAKGVVYVLVGGLAVRAAAGWGGRATGSRGALRSLLDQPYGLAILAGVSVGAAPLAGRGGLRGPLRPGPQGR